MLAELAATAPVDAPVHSAASGCAKLLWLVRRGLPADTVHALHQAEWLAGRLIGRFDLFLIDQYGVLHNGAAPYPGAVEALSARLFERPVETIFEPEETNLDRGDSLA